jgi:hypothetical protein
MEINKLKQLISEHTGTFQCTIRGDGTRSKQVQFKHLCTPPTINESLPNLGKLKEFYSQFGDLQLYHDQNSDDSAYYIANPNQWDVLEYGFNQWIDSLDEAEQEELLPNWIDAYLVIGEIANSGNYLLMPTKGNQSGHVIEFDHDGFEFTDLGSDITAAVVHLLNPDNVLLTCIASYMTFIDQGSFDQWWIEEMRDNYGNIVKTGF